MAGEPTAWGNNSTSPAPAGGWPRSRAGAPSPRTWGGARRHDLGGHPPAAPRWAPRTAAEVCGGVSPQTPARPQEALQRLRGPREARPRAGKQPPRTPGAVPGPLTCGTARGNHSADGRAPRAGCSEKRASRGRGRRLGSRGPQPSPPGLMNGTRPRRRPSWRWAARTPRPAPAT